MKILPEAAGEVAVMIASNGFAVQACIAPCWLLEEPKVLAVFNVLGPLVLDVLDILGHLRLVVLPLDLGGHETECSCCNLGLV